MLSSENPPPPPPLLLKSVSDKRADCVEVDLLSSSHTRFSIRDYVFTARSKDIKTHWPFSPENLQLCLKNGVEEVLPPFETLETVKNPVKRANELTTNLVSGPISSKNAIVEPDIVENFKSSSPEQEDDEEYCSDVNPVSFHTKSPIPAAQKPVTTVRATDKGKKCRLIVKLGNNNISEPKSSECDFPEAMASSKVCPVCKTFNSSSNTTLNAHIDQCLSGESMVKTTEKPKVMIKHRITKPRKVRLMADIYETALSCTLEDLDRRNGTNWASNVSVPALDQENNGKESTLIISENKKESSLIISENKKEEGAVYIDSNGVKVRILSKLSDMNPSTNGEDDCGLVPKKLLERDKVSKILPSKKKKKHLSILKSSPYPEEMNFPPEENEKDDSAQPLEASCGEDEIDQMKSKGSGLIKQWMSSKRTTSHKNKIKSGQKSLNPEKNIATKNTRTKSSQLPSLDDHMLIKRTRDLGLPISTSDNLSPDPLPALESQKRKESMEQMPCLTNRAGYSLFDSGDFHYDKETKSNNMMLLRKRNFKRRKARGISFQNGKEFKKLSTSEKIQMSNKHKSFSESKKCLGSTNLLKFKKSYANDKVETIVEKDSDSDHSSFDHMNRVLKPRKSRRGSFNSTYPKHSSASSESDSREFEHNISSFAGDDCIQGGMSDSSNAVETRDELISKIAYGGEPLIAYDESLAYEEEMLSAGKALVSEVKVNEGEKGNYFVDVDPITIPGPPGSFLPSPGRMGSEELQGNSSLTSCRVHSSGNERALVDRMDSLDSPVSGSSFVSNSIAFRTHATPNVIGRGTGRPNPISVFPIGGGGDCESPSPSTPNHILRLMGKNLMVVNKEADCVPKIGPTIAGDENAQRSDLVSDFRTQVSGMISSRQGFVSSMDFHGYSTRHDFEGAHGTPSINPHPYLAGNQQMGGRYYYPRHENPISGYQTMLYNPMHHFPPDHQNNGNLMTWSHAPEPTGHERSPLYFTGGVSLPTKFA